MFLIFIGHQCKGKNYSSNQLPNLLINGWRPNGGNMFLSNNRYAHSNITGAFAPNPKGFGPSDIGMDMAKDLMNEVVSWFTNKKFVLEVNWKVTAGVQGKAKLPIFGLATASLSANLVSVELFSGTYNFTESQLTTNTIFKEVWIENDVSLSVKPTNSKVGVHVGVRQSFQPLSGGGYSNHQSDWSIVPVFDSPQWNDIVDHTKNQGLETGFNKVRTKPSGDFKGIETGIGAALGLGVFLNIKIGFQ